MSYINKTISRNSTEADFLWDFIQSFSADLTATGWNFTCNLSTRSAFDDWFNEAPLSFKAFQFVIADDFQINISRTQAESNDKRQNYWFQFQYGDVHGGVGVGDGGGNYLLPFASVGYVYNAIQQRTFKYQIISNAKALHIRFGAYNASFPLTANAGMFYADGGLKFMSLGSDNLFFVGSTGIPATKKTRLIYLRNAEDFSQIEVIKNLAIADNDANSLIANPDSIWDSTYNSAVGFPLTIGSDRCCYLDNYTVMKC